MVLGSGHKEFYMTEINPLNELYLLYSGGDLTKKDFEGLVFQYLLGNYEKYGVFNGNRDVWDEFLSWFYSHLGRAIDLYRDLGSSFDAYINSLVHCSSQEYRSREAEHYLTECICWQAKAEDMHLREYEPEYSRKQEKIFIPNGIKPRQILFLLLKAYYFVTDEYVERTAKTIGIKSETIWEMIEKLKDIYSRRDAEMMNLRERVYCQHYRCLVYQKRMVISQQGTEHYEKMRRRFERAKKRFSTMKKRLGGIKMAASNRMIADVLGIPKGTVDSGLSAIKNQFPL